MVSLVLLDLQSDGWNYINGIPVISSQASMLILTLLAAAYVAFQMLKIMYQSTKTPTSHTYEGDYNDQGEWHGKGKLFAINGDVYSGEFKKGKFHGQGVYKFQDGLGQYQGPFIDGAFHGSRGVENYPDGSVYIGAFQHGSRHGKGTMKYVNGTQYTGEWVEGKKHGKGKFLYANGDKYIGGFAEGKRHGQGQIKEKKSGKIKYGVWKFGELTGELVELNNKDKAKMAEVEQAELETELPAADDNSREAKMLREKFNNAKLNAQENKSKEGETE